MATRLSSKDREVYRRIVRDIEGGRALGVFSEEDYFKPGLAAAACHGHHPAD